MIRDKRARDACSKSVGKASEASFLMHTAKPRDEAELKPHPKTEIYNKRKSSMRYSYRRMTSPLANIRASRY